MAYRMFMPKKGISVTLRDDNLTWLKGRTIAARKRSLSETLDDLVTAVREGAGGSVGASRSVAGTIDIANDDPGLEQADEYVRGLVRSSLARPVIVRESSRHARRASSPKKGRRRG